MKKSSSTKMEEAWFVDPELLAGEEGEDQPPIDDLDVDSQRRNETLTLSEGDFEEAPEFHNKGTDSGTIKYRDVALKGAIMAPEEAVPMSAALAAKEGMAERIRGLIPKDGSAKAKVKAMIKAAGGKLVIVVDLFEQGRVPPIWLAAISFFAGVITTLIGVFLAL